MSAAGYENNPSRSSPPIDSMPTSSTSSTNPSSAPNSNKTPPNNVDQSNNIEKANSDDEISGQVVLSNTDGGGGGSSSGSEEEEEDAEEEGEGEGEGEKEEKRGNEMKHGDDPMLEIRQKRILKVMRDHKLSADQKNIKIQNIHSSRYKKRQRQASVAGIEDLNKRARTASKSCVHDSKTGRALLGCKHYARNCKLFAECCKAWVVCRHCHDEHPSMTHTMDRFATKKVRCMLCPDDDGQPVASHCRRCGTEFAKHFCKECKFYDNDPKKDIYHCSKCKICRLGRKEENFHCPKCDACVSRKYFNEHKCLKKSLDANCPICGLYIKTSTKPVVFMQCGHTMHAHCFDEYTNEYFYCPICHKSLSDMKTFYDEIRRGLEKEILPPEIRNRGATVFCHDCDQRCETDFHVIYLKCARCNGYNTTLIKSYEKTGQSSANVVQQSQQEASGSQSVLLREEQANQPDTGPPSVAKPLEEKPKGTSLMSSSSPSSSSSSSSTQSISSDVIRKAKKKARRNILLSNTSNQLQPKPSQLSELKEDNEEGSSNKIDGAVESDG